MTVSDLTAQGTEPHIYRADSVVCKHYVNRPVQKIKGFLLILNCLRLDNFLSYQKFLLLFFQIKATANNN